MTPEERKVYMKIYNQTEKAKAAKESWRVSSEGREYRQAYAADYDSRAEVKERKSSKQRHRRKTSSYRKEVDKKYAFEYCRREEVKSLKNAKRRELRKTSVSYRLSERIRGRIKDLLGRDRPEAVSKSLGCTAAQLLEHLQIQFQPGMSWENYGFYGWHIDHIKPLASFDLLDLSQYRQACHYTNLQPMWAKKNLQKGSKTE